MRSEPISISKEAIVAHAPGNGKPALVLLQGHAGSGFGLVCDGSLLLKLTPDVDFNPQQFWDIRVFNETGEWHSWRMPDRSWRARTAECSEWSDCCIDREYALWGTQIRHVDADWHCCAESGRGTELYLPRLLFGDLKTNDLPVRLKAKLRVGADAAGISGVMDCMFCGWIWRRP